MLKLLDKVVNLWTFEQLAMATALCRIVMHNSLVAMADVVQDL